MPSTLHHHNLYRIFLHGIDGLHKCHSGLRIEQLDEADRLVEWRLLQLRDIVHVAILLDVVDDLVNKLDLPLVQRLVIDEG